MTELEKQLSSALSQLSTQYAQDMKRLEDRTSLLQRQVATLTGSVEKLMKKLDQLSGE